MRILFVGSKKLQISGPVFALNRLGHQIEMYPNSIEEIQGNEEQERQLETFLKRTKIDFVMSLAFSKEAAEVTNRLGLKYAVWCMDSPAFPAWTPEVDYDNCYLFYFDYREYEIKRQGGQGNAYHLPLAADDKRSGHLVITDEELRKYSCHMSFVGGLYSNNTYDQQVEMIPVRIRNTFAKIMEKSSFVWDGQDRLHIPSEVM